MDISHPTPEGAEVTEREYEAAAALRSALREFLTETEKITRKHGLTAEQYQLLLLIQVSPEQERTISRLCRELIRRQSAVTQLARRAEDLGLIERSISKRDARVRYLELTAEGQKRLDGAITELGGERNRLLDALDAIEHRSP